MSVDLRTIATLNPDKAIPSANDIVTPKMMDDVQSTSDRYGGEPVQIEVHLSATEVAVAELIARLHSLIGTFYDMMGKGREAGMGRQKNYPRDVSHFADNVALLINQAVNEAVAKCGTAPETEKPAKIVQGMLLELQKALKTVNNESNSAPTIGAARLFYQCAHLVLRNTHTDQQRQAGVAAWRDKLRRCMAV